MKCVCGSEVEKGQECATCDAKKARMARYDKAIADMLNDPNREPMDFYDVIEEVIHRADAMKPSRETIFDFLRREGNRQAAKSIWDVLRPGHPMWEPFAAAVLAAIAPKPYEGIDPGYSEKSPTVTIRPCPNCGSDEHLIVKCGQEDCETEVCFSEGCYSSHYSKVHPSSLIVSLEVDASDVERRPPPKMVVTVERGYSKDIFRRMYEAPHGNPDWMPGLEASWAFPSAMKHLAKALGQDPL